jgi:MFS family permease
LFYATIQFPPAKQHELAAKSQVKNLLKPVLLLIALFLFFQSSLEAIINNWTTTYLVTRGVMSESLALYALSIHITGMVAMRLLTGSLLRPVSHILIIWISLALVAIGVLLMLVTGMKGVVFAGLFFFGAGLAGGFPIMLGFVGDRFPSYRYCFQPGFHRCTYWKHAYQLPDGNCC